MTATMLDLLCILIGGATGLRSLAGIALVAMAAQSSWPPLGWLHSGRLHLEQTGLRLLAAPAAMWVLVLFALGELVADKLPKIPSRISPGPLAFRFVMAALCGSALAVAASRHWLLPGLLAGVSAVVAAYAGYWLRRTITSRGVKDLPIALLEDAVAILTALFVVSRF